MCVWRLTASVSSFQQQILFPWHECLQEHLNRTFLFYWIHVRLHLDLLPIAHNDLYELLIDIIAGVCTDSDILSLILEILIDCVKSNDVKKVSVFG